MLEMSENEMTLNLKISNSIYETSKEMAMSFFFVLDFLNCAHNRWITFKFRKKIQKLVELKTFWAVKSIFQFFI